MRLSHQDFISLIEELDKTPLMEGDEIRYMKSAHPQLYSTYSSEDVEGRALFTESGKMYSLRNSELNKKICDLFDPGNDNVYSIHRLVYGPGGLAKKHKDRFTTYKTVSLILSGDFTGGEMYINDEMVEMTKTGDYVVFNGGKDFHEIKEIVSGKREVLIIWFSKKSAKFTLI